MLSIIPSHFIFTHYPLLITPMLGQDVTSRLTQTFHPSKYLRAHPTLLLLFSITILILITILSIMIHQTPDFGNTFHSSTDSSRIPQIPAGIQQFWRILPGICRNPTGTRYLGYILLPNKVIALNLSLIYTYQDLLTYLCYILSQSLLPFHANDLII